MNLPLTNITTRNVAVRVLLASSRFGDECLPQLMGPCQLLPVLCRQIPEMLKSLQHDNIEVLVLDVALLQQQTQHFCWQTQNLYSALKIILLGQNPRELASHNWVYEFPSISTACASFESEPESSVSPSKSAMLSDPNSESSGSSYLDSIVGAAIFDLSGLPREYLITNDIDNMSWVQTIFQALGLRSLLMSSLQLEGFHHVAIYTRDYCSLVVKQKNQYTALLISHAQSQPIAPDFIEWARHFEPSQLKSNPQFYVA